MNIPLKEELLNIKKEFEISNTKLTQIAGEFYEDMSQKNILKMLPSYVELSPEAVSGEYLTIDFGGSNIRVSKIKIENDTVTLEKRDTISLRTKFKDYTTEEFTLKDLLRLSVDKLSKLIDTSKMYNLALTFSFAFKPNSKSSATILDLSKGFSTRNAIGIDIYSLLNEVINEAGLKIIPASVINDSVATLIAGNYYYPNANIAFIVGTGHNACFIDTDKELINIESGLYNKNIPLTLYDNNFIKTLPPNEKNNLLEILTGGKYLGGIAQTIYSHLINKNLLKKDIPVITSTLLTETLNKKFTLKYTAEQKEVLTEIAKILLERAAKLIVAESAAILKYIDPELSIKHTIIFDGSVYEKNAYFRESISKEIDKFFLSYSSQIAHKLMKDASSTGAAISVASKKQ